MNSLQNKVAVITGATSGIGEAVAYTLAEHGVRLLLHGRDKDKLLPLATQLSASYVLGDLTDPEISIELLEKAKEQFNGCDIVINNAGMLETGNIEEINIDRVCEMVRVNVEAAFRVAYTFTKYFKTQGSGDLINISSVMGTKVRETTGAYAGTKFAIEALSEGLRMELARTNVRVTCIEPGVVTTNLHRYQSIPTAQLLDIPKPLTAKEVADMIVYVLQLERSIRIPKMMILPKDHVI